MNKEDQKTTKQPLLGLSLGALGIIYSDIGTSPLYAFRESFGNLTINVVDVLGTLSLILWTLILVISVLRIRGIRVRLALFALSLFCSNPCQACFICLIIVL